VVIAFVAFTADAPAQAVRKSAREIGIIVGVLPPGPLNAITDVGGVRVGQVTIARGDSINTGVTAILPHGGNVFREKVPAAVVVGNGYGKFVGATQIQELGELESPIVLTCTLCVPRVADAVLTYLLGLPGNEDVRSANPVVGETNDGRLSHIRLRPVGEGDVLRALAAANTGPVEQGSVGAGRGTTAFGWKAGIGTSSRRIPPQLGGWTVGVLVQANFGTGVLMIRGAPVGQELGRFYLQESVAPKQGSIAKPRSHAGQIVDAPDGSIIIVVATDASLESRNLERLARRALGGLARTGSSLANTSGDYVVAFSTRLISRRPDQPELPNEVLNPLFEAVIEATEEAIYNSLLLATSVRGYLSTIPALPLDSTVAILKRYGVITR